MGALWLLTEFGNLGYLRENMYIKRKLYIIDSVETNNFNDSQIMLKIGELWQRVTNTLPKDCVKYGVYHDYESDFKGNYTLSVAIESDNGSVLLEINGEYKVFDVDTTFENSIAKTWKKIWKMPISRAYTFDFEYYNPDGTIQIYIAVK
jgi:predicted transcriptional regulator YdeE